MTTFSVEVTPSLFGRQLDEISGDINAETLGAIPNDSSVAARAANDAAIEAVKTLDSVIQDTFYGTARSISWPGTAYYFGSAGHDLKLTRRWRGAPSGAALAGGHLRTQFIIPAGCKFLRVENYNTIGETTEVTPTTSAAGSMFVDIDFIGNDGVEPNAAAAQNTSGYAIHPRTMIAAWNCRFRYHYNGIYNNAASGAGGADEGQASHCHYFQCSFEQNFNAGIANADAPDNNIQNYHHCNFIANGRAGIIGGEFLGSNVSPSCHFRDNGCRTDYFTVSSQCTYGGNRYYVNETATMATTNAALRVGNPTSNSLWTLYGAGGVHPNYPDFTTFTGTFQKGSPIIADRTTNAAWTAVGHYGESAQPPFFWNTSCTVIPGLCGNDNVGMGTLIVQGRIVSSQVAALGQTTVGSISGGATAALMVPGERIHNKTALATSVYSGLVFAQGYNANGSACDLGGWAYYSAGTDPATNVGLAVLFTRAAGGTLTERAVWDTNNGNAFRPWVDATYDLGLTGGQQWRDANLSRAVKIAGNQVVGARDTGWTADTGAAKKTATAAYAVGSGLTVSAGYVQAEHTAIITRQALIEAALRDATQEIKALKDLVLAHGLAGA